MGEEFAHEARLVVERRDRGVDGGAAARPADLANHDLLARVRARHFVVALEGIFDRLVHRQTLVIGQQVDGDVVDVLGELGIAQPDVPGLGGRYRLADRLTDAVEVADHLVDGQVAAQDHFVADHHPFDVTHAAGDVDQGLDLALVGVGAGVEPGAGGDKHVAFAREIEQIRHVGDAVGAQAVGAAPEQVEVGGEFRTRGIGALERTLVALETVVGKTLDALVGADEFRAAVELLPDPVLCEGDGGGDHDRNGDAGSKGGGFFHLVSSALRRSGSAQALQVPCGQGCQSDVHDHRPLRAGAMSHCANFAPVRAVTQCAGFASTAGTTPTGRILCTISAAYERVAVPICNSFSTVRLPADFEGKGADHAN